MSTLPSNPVYSAAFDSVNQGVRDDAANTVRNLALASLGIGAAGRGAYGLYNVLRRNLKSRPRPSSAVVMPIPYPVTPAEEEEAARKVAEPVGHWAGGDATSVTGVPWFLPAATAAVLGPAYAGWKTVDHVLDKRRRDELEAAKSKAKQRFQAALLQQYPSPVKRASATSTLGEKLDRIYDLFTKAAFWPSPDTWGKMEGAGMTYAGLTALGTGAYVYDAMRKRQRRALLQKALDNYQRQQYRQRPPELFAQPMPVEAVESST